MKPRAYVLVVDDEPAMCMGLQDILEERGFAVDTANGADAGMQRFEKRDFDVVITDLVMDGMDGMAFLEWIKERRPTTPVIMITGFSTVATAVEAMRKGAFDYIAKPFKLDEVRIVVERALHVRSLERENRLLREKLSEHDESNRLVGDSPAMEAVREMIARVAPSDSPVLIGGETGTGKEVVAREVHRLSTRAKKTLVTVNCAALPDTLLESELFGHAKGAFTGATDDREGLFAAAEGGTIFLDEIGDISLAAQARLLRVLQDGEVRRIGENTASRVDVRVLAATNRDLRARAAEKTFREDLYYRLNGLTITLPPLRERGRDIERLAEHFAHRYSTRPDGGPAQIDAAAMEVLAAYRWPGNVRELENTIRRALVMGDGRVIRTADLPAELRGEAKEEASPSADSLEAVESRHIARVLRSTRGNLSRAADVLGISRPTLRAKIARYGIDVDAMK